MSGLYYFKHQRYKKALEELRRADSYSRMSGNRFFDGIFLPAHAAAAVCHNEHSNPTIKESRGPEVKQIRRRARWHAKLAQSAFYDSLVNALDAVIAHAEKKHGAFNRLKDRANRWSPDGLVTIYRLDELESEQRK